jgi:WD40 repeat protein
MHEQEHPQQKWRSPALLIGGIGVVVVVLVVVLVLVSGLVPWFEDEHVRLSRTLAAHAEQEPDQTLALLLAVKANTEARTPASEAALFARLERTPYLEATLHGHSNSVTSVAFSPDGTLLAAAVLCAHWDEPSSCGEGEIVLWDMTHDPPVTQAIIRGHAERIWHVAFHPDGALLASASWDETVKIWDVTSDPPVLHATLPGNGPIEVVTFSPDGTLLAAAEGRTVRVWDMTHDPPAVQVVLSERGSHSVAFSPDGTLLAADSYTASANEDTVQVWDMTRDPPETRALLTVPVAGFSLFPELNSVVFSPDGTLLTSTSCGKAAGKLSICTAGDIILWDITHDPPVEWAVLRGHEENIYQVAFSPDGTLLVSAGMDETVRVWDMTRDPPEVQTIFESGISFGHSVAFSPDGHTLASASSENTVKLWNISLESWKARACRAAGRNLTLEEWQQYMGGDRPYEKTCPDLPSGAGVEEE